MSVPASRLRALNDAAPAGGRYVLYWMIAARRLRHNFALQHAVARANEHGVPLVVFEPLRAGYPHASDRLHRFVLDGMADHAAALEGRPGVRYRAYVEPAAGDGKGLLEALAADACLVVTDDWPGFFMPAMLAAAGGKVPVPLEAVDGNGLLPLLAADRAFPTAHAFRRHLHKTLPAHLGAFPAADPLAALHATARPLLAGLDAWPEPSPGVLAGRAGWADGLRIDHAVAPTGQRGGPDAGRRVLAGFVRDRLPRYDEDRNDPGLPGASGLSPYLHFGHVGAHEAVRAVFDAEGWDPSKLAGKPTGSKAGWWNLSAPAEAFLDELVTWREVGLNGARHLPRHQAFDSLPGWALATLAKHARDPRPSCYDLASLEAAATHDPVWNAAQRQLLREGRIHNYMRMLWGKKVLEWSPSPEAALAALLHLNDRHALDGRDPNSISGIFWCLGRYDRAWGPERPIFGTVRYMSSANTARKLNLKPYLQKYSES